MNSTDAAVFIAPVGTPPSDSGGWTHIGYTSDVPLRADDGFSPAPDEYLPRMTKASTTVSLRMIRHLVPPCADTIAAITKHAQRSRLMSLLTEARQQPATLPCPRPF